MPTTTWFQAAARTSLRGGAADVAIQGFCLRVVDAAEESERMELDCRVAALLAMTGWGVWGVRDACAVGAARRAGGPTRGAGGPDGFQRPVRHCEEA